MEQFIRIGEHTPQIGISDFTATHCQVVQALLKHTVPLPTSPKDIRGQFRSALQHGRRAQVSIMPELSRHIGPIEPEVHYPNLMLQEVSYAASSPSRIEIPSKYTLDGVHSWKHSTLVQHTFLDRLYQSSDSDLADPRRILTLTVGRCGIILGAANTPNHDRAFLLALYAATVRLEAEMRQGHPRFVACIPGGTVMNRHRLRFYTSALDFIKVHVENLLRVSAAHLV